VIAFIFILLMILFPQGFRNAIIWYSKVATSVCVLDVRLCGLTFRITFECVLQALREGLQEVHRTRVRKVLGPGSMKVRTSVIKPKITSVSQFPV